MTTATWVDHNGLEALHLTALEELGGVKAIFTGRKGGVSDRWSGGLNWSISVGDEPASVRENRRRSLALLGLPVSAAAIAGLVHGDRVVALPASEPFASPGDDLVLVPDTDGLITDRVGLALVVTAADCVPLYFYDPVRRVVGAAHAGWRGTVAGIGAKTVRAMAERFGCIPDEIHAAVGPSIGPCCYEVDDMVAEPIRRYYGQQADQLLLPGRQPGRYQLDLWSANRLDLLGAGVGHVHVAGECTSHHCDRLFSHRAEQGTAGRGAAIITLA